MGLPKAEIPLALLLFNVGVEIGQMFFVAVILLLERSFRTLEIRWPRWAEALPGYAVGSLGAYWTIQRTVDAVRRRAMSARRAGRRPRASSRSSSSRSRCRPRARTSQAGEAAGFLGGFRHPISGLDHVLAMVSVGLWGAQLGAPAIWLLPVVFPMVMAFGGFLGLAGVPLPGVEIAIALSAVLLGLAVAKEARPPLAVAAALVGFFAIFHGHAHGTELPAGQSGILYSIGFVVATGLLHLTGIGDRPRPPLALGTRRAARRRRCRRAAGIVFLWRALT